MPEIFEFAKENKNHVILVVNKVDCLPKHVSFNRTQKWVRNLINPFTEDLVRFRGNFSRKSLFVKLVQRQDTGFPK